MFIVNIQVELLITTRCHSEGVEVRDGGTASSPLLDGDLPYCNDKPDTKRSTGNVMYVRYFSTKSSPNIGFQAKVKVGKSPYLILIMKVSKTSNMVVFTADTPNNKRTGH